MTGSGEKRPQNGTIRTLGRAMEAVLKAHDQLRSALAEAGLPPKMIDPSYNASVKLQDRIAAHLERT